MVSLTISTVEGKLLTEEEVLRAYTLKVLELAPLKGKLKKAAEIMNINRRTLYRRLNIEGYYAFVNDPRYRAISRSETAQPIIEKFE